MTTTTITFQTNMATMIKKLADLSWDRNNDSYDRVAIVGTKEEWAKVLPQLYIWRNESTRGEKRSFTAAIKRIELKTEQGQYYKKALVKRAKERVAFLARQEARRASKAKYS